MNISSYPSLKYTTLIQYARKDITDIVLWLIYVLLKCIVKYNFIKYTIARIYCNIYLALKCTSATQY